MSMRIEQIDPVRNDADLAAVVSCVQRTYGDVLGDFPVPGAQRMRFWRSDGYEYTITVFGAYGDAGDVDGGGRGDLLGFSNLGLEIFGNLELSQSAILVAAPATSTVTGAQVAEALLAHAVEFCLGHGRTRLAVGLPNGLSAEDYAPIRTGRLTYTAVRSVLDLRSVDREQFTAWAEPSGKNKQYRLVRWIDHCPDEFVDAFLVAMTAMEDAPQEEMAIEHLKPELELLRGMEDHSRRYGVRRYATAAVDADGVIAGYTMFTEYPEEPRALDIWDTGVAREHRGRGLGLRLKADSTLWMLQDCPGADYVHTYNNQSNEHMLAVNRRLGYRAADRDEIYEFSFA